MMMMTLIIKLRAMRTVKNGSVRTYAYKAFVTRHICILYEPGAAHNLVRGRAIASKVGTSYRTKIFYLTKINITKCVKVRVDNFIQFKIY